MMSPPSGYSSGDEAVPYATAEQAASIQARPQNGYSALVSMQCLRMVCYFQAPPMDWCRMPLPSMPPGAAPRGCEYEGLQGLQALEDPVATPRCIPLRGCSMGGRR